VFSPLHHWGRRAGKKVCGHRLGGLGHMGRQDRHAWRRGDRAQQSLKKMEDGLRLVPSRSVAFVGADHAGARAVLLEACLQLSHAWQEPTMQPTPT